MILIIVSIPRRSDGWWSMNRVVILKIIANRRILWILSKMSRTAVICHTLHCQRTMTLLYASFAHSDKPVQYRAVEHSLILHATMATVSLVHAMNTLIYAMTLSAMLLLDYVQYDSMLV